MTTIEIELPDQLAQEATQAGLLSPTAIEEILRERLKKQHVDELFQAMDRMSAVDDPELTSDDVAQEIAAVRAERRARALAG